MMIVQNAHKKDLVGCIYMADFLVRFGCAFL
jgi:hypothetical protein